MNNYLAVFDGLKISKSTMLYAIQLTKATGGRLTGIFLDDLIYRSYNVSEVLSASSKPGKAMQLLDAKDKKKRDEAAVWFRKECEEAGIRFSVHRDKNIALQELKHESMFADLVIINENETFTKYREKPPTRFIKNLLGDVQCPVVVVPNNYKEIDNVILLYDGRPSSLYAIKMFSYLCGDLCILPVEVFAVNDYYLANVRLPDNKLMRTFIKRVFPHATFNVTRGGAEEQILNYLSACGENCLVVLGAYQRSDLSRWFKTSMADVLMKELNIPLFIAHHK